MQTPRRNAASTAARRGVEHFQFDQPAKLLRGGGRLVLSLRQSRLEPRGFLGVNQPLGTRLIEPLGNVAECDGRSRLCGFQTGSEFLHECLQRRHLRSVLQTSFLSLAIRLGSIGIVGHVELTGSRSIGQNSPRRTANPSRRKGRDSRQPLSRLPANPNRPSGRAILLGHDQQLFGCGAAHGDRAVASAERN